MARVIDAFEMSIIAQAIVIPRNFTLVLGATLLFSRLILSFSFFSMYWLIDASTRSAALRLETKILQSSANRQKLSSRFSSSVSSSCNTTLLSRGLSGLPCTAPSVLSISSPLSSIPLLSVMPIRRRIRLSLISSPSRWIRRS